MRTFSFQEYQTLQWVEKNETPFVTSNAVKVLEARYLKKDKKGKVIENPKDLFERVAKAVAGGERVNSSLTEEQIQLIESQFYTMMARGLFMPNSPTLMNAGREMGMLSACFVLPVEDSIDGIFSSIKNTALIQKAGGGTGFDFSQLRPAGDLVNSSGGTTSGPLSFIEVFSKATDAIQQGAFRRGANMGILSITHPDIVEFINYKEDLTKLNNYNISVSISDAFMEELKKNSREPHQVTNPRTGETFPLEKKDKKGVYWTKGELFDLIIQRAWSTGEPGLIFIDRINQDNPTPHLGRMTATNPCGEQPLLPYEACNLGSINLGKFVEQDQGGGSYFNWQAYREVIHVATRFLDNVVDVNNYPIPEIAERCRGNRKIGLGVMGFADALFLLGIPYNSEGGIQFGEQVMAFLQNESHTASESLANEKGVFPNWEGSTWQTRFNRKMRNACTTTVAPTGTISIISNCSGGIEPLFSLAFYRNVLNGQKLVEVNPFFKKAAQEKSFYSDELIQELAQKGTLAECKGIPDEVKKVYVCAHDIVPEWHIKMQAAFQRYCDASISKTTNFPHSATAEEVRRIYEMAYDYKLKGITVYRDGCRQNQPMALDNQKKEKNKVEAVKCAESPLKPKVLPEIMTCLRIRQHTPFGNMHVKISVEPQTEKEMEVFAQLGKGGDVANSDLEAICRMISLFLRSGGELKLVSKQIDGIGSSMTIPSRDGRVMSLADGLAKAIKKYLKAKELFGLKGLILGEVDIEKIHAKGKNEGPAGFSSNGNLNGNQVGATLGFKIKCPECQNNLNFSEGCVKCEACGFSQC